MRFCRQGDKYDTSNDRPSGTYIGVATNLPIPYDKWSCKCEGPWENHVLDWYEQQPEHAEWRKKMRIKYARLLFEDVIKDNVTPPPVTEDTMTTMTATAETRATPVSPTAYPNCTCDSCKTYYKVEQSMPTEARLRQKTTSRRP